MDHLKSFPRSSKSFDLIPHLTASRDAGQETDYSHVRYGLERPQDDESDNSLLEYWQILRRHKKVIVVAAFVGALLGFAVGVPMTPVYRASILLEVLSLNENFMNMKDANQTTTSNYSYDASEEQTQAKLLQTSALLNRVIKKLDPDVVRIQPETKTSNAWWRNLLHRPGPVNTTPKRALLNNLARSLVVKVTSRTRVLEATVDSKDPQLAADFANTLVQEFIQQNLEERYTATHRTSEWLSSEINDARLKLERSEDALQSYARKSGLIFSDEDTNAAGQKLQQVQLALSTASTDRISKQSRFELAKSSPPEALADIVDNEGLTELSAKINDLTRQVADLSVIYNPDFSKLRRTNAELVSLQTSFNQARGEILRRIENDYQQALRNEKLLTAAYDTQIGEVTGQGEKSIQYNMLKREVESNRQLYDTMLQQTKQASVASAMRASNVRVIDPAESPTSPISPDFKVNAVIGLFMGLFLSVASVIMRERVDRTFQQPGDVKLWLDLSELGTIPNAKFMKSAYGYGRDSQAALTAPVVSTSISGQRSAGDPTAVELITWMRKPSAMAEAFRSALTSLLFIGENGNRPRILVFTSVAPSDGKTTMISNLAIATAEIHRKVLIIDADMRRPRMHQVFTLPQSPGLTDLLSNEFSDESVDGLIQETGIPGLDVIPSGLASEAAANLLHSPNFAELLTRVRDRYDMVFIDTPPMLQMTDARVVGRLADAVVLVARAGRTTRDSLAAVAERFADDRTRVLGSILNDWDPKRSTNGNYSSSYSSRHYGRYTQDTHKN